MATFIETTIYEWDAFVNVDAIEMLRPDFEDSEASIIRWRRPYEQTSPEGGSVLSGFALEYNEDHVQEPYDSLKAKILAATAKEGKETFPPTTPHKEKGEVQQGLLPVIREKKRLKPRSSIAQAIDFRR